MTQPKVRFLDVPSSVISAETILPGVEPEKVYALVSNPFRHHELDGSGSVQGQISGPEAPGEGETFRQSMRLYGIPYTATSTVYRAEPNRAFGWRRPTGFTWTWEMEPTDEGTLVREAFDASHASIAGLPLAGALRMAGAFQRNRRGIATSLSRLSRRFA